MSNQTSNRETLSKQRGHHHGHSHSHAHGQHGHDGHGHDGNGHSHESKTQDHHEWSSNKQDASGDPNQFLIGTNSHQRDSDNGAEGCHHGTSSSSSFGHQHVHGPNCGHIAILHLDRQGSNSHHFGFIVKGELVCFDSPNEAHLVESHWKATEPLQLIQSTRHCKLSSIFPMREETQQEQEPNSKTKLMTVDVEGALAHVSHADHYDALLNDDAGNVLLKSTSSGAVHGVLFRNYESIHWWSDLLLAPGVVPTVVNEQPSDQEHVRSVLSISGVCCNTEVPSVVACCMKVQGVQKVEVSVISRRVYIIHERIHRCVPYQVSEALCKSHFESSVVKNGADNGASNGSSKSTLIENHSSLDDDSSNEQFKSTSLKWYVKLALIFWILSWLEYFALPLSVTRHKSFHWLIGVVGHEDEDGDLHFENMRYLGLVAVFLAFPHIALKGFYSLQRRIVDVNILMSVAVIGAVAIGDYNEAATVVIIFSVSDYLSDKAGERARTALKILMDMKPDMARDASTNTIIPAEDVQLGQVLLVLAGEKIPVDGILLSSDCELDESSLTGESRPVHKQSGDFVHAGTLNVSSVFAKIQCVALAKDSAVARMIRLVETASTQRSPTEMLVDRFARYYTPAMIIIALGFATVPWFWGKEIGMKWLKISLTLLVVACPCALVISTPVTYCCALTQCARFGVLVKGGKYLETFARVDLICCDKTGTLTKGAFVVDEIVFVNQNESEEEKQAWLGLLFEIESKGVHPISVAIANHCKPYCLKRKLDVVHAEVVPGSGMKVDCVNGGDENYGEFEEENREIVTCYVVAEKSRAQYQVGSSPELDDLIAKFTTCIRGRTVSWLIVDGKPVVGMAATDEVRPEARPCVEELDKLGISLNVLTGDNECSARLLQKHLPKIDGVFFNLHPADKVDKVSEFRKQHHVVCMVGDGVNDAPAFSAADVGVAMAYGAPLAIETADCALMDNDLKKLPKLLRLARRTRRTIKQNLGFSFVSKIVVLGLTFGGMMTLGIAVAADVGAMLLVTMNGVALIDFTKRRGVQQ